MAGLTAFGCGSPNASLEISAPSAAIVGSPFTVTVTAIVDGHRDTIFNSPIHFTSSDIAAVVPTDYVFTAADAGSHTFTNGVTLMTAGSQSIKATDVFAASITATASVTVTAATTDMQFKLSAPSNVTADSAFSATVSAEGANGNVLPGYTQDSSLHQVSDGALSCLLRNVKGRFATKTAKATRSEQVKRRRETGSCVDHITDDNAEPRF